MFSTRKRIRGVTNSDRRITFQTQLSLPLLVVPFEKSTGVGRLSNLFERSESSIQKSTQWTGRIRRSWRGGSISSIYPDCRSRFSLVQRLPGTSQQDNNSAREMLGVSSWQCFPHQVKNQMETLFPGPKQLAKQTTTSLYKLVCFGSEIRF